MKKSAIKKIFACASACVLAFCSLGITASAAVKSGDKDTSAPITAHLKNEYGEIYFTTESPAPTVSSATLFSEDFNAAEPTGDEFFDRCRGQQWGYNNLNPADYPTLTRLCGSEAPKKVYDNLYKACTNIWFSTADINPTTISGYSNSILFTTDAVPEITKLFYTTSVSDEDVNGLISDINNLYFSFRNDNPLFYFAYNHVIGSANGKLSVVVGDEAYLYGSTRASMQETVKSYVKSTEQLVKKDYKHTDYQNAFELYKSVMNRTEYASGDRKATWYNIIGCIVGENCTDEGASKRLCVCEGYSKTFSLLLNYHGIDNLVVSGIGIVGYDAQGNPVEGPHAWNMLKLDDGKYYFADATWDDYGTGSVNNNRNEYFAKGFETFKTDHELDSLSAHNANPSRNDFLYTVPAYSSANYNTSGDYRSTNPRLVDFNTDSANNDLDIRTLQDLIGKKLITASDLKYFDLNNDSKMNNRDLKELQKIIASFAQS